MTPAWPPLRERLSAWRAWPREMRDTLFTLAVIAWTVLPHLIRLPLWCGVLTGGVLLWRAGLALRNAALPPRWAVAAVLLIALGGTAWSERTLIGREAGVTMLVMLMALKTLELRARRDAIVVFFLGFFLVLTLCLYSQSLLTALAMGVSTWGLLTALVLANMPVGRPPLWRAASLAARSSLWGLPLMAALFVLFPRFGPLWGLPQDGVGRSGLSGTLRLGGVAALASDESIAFRVRFEGGPPPSEALYFRGPVLTRFDGLEWRPGLFAGRRPEPGSPSTPSLRVAGPALRYEMLIEPIRLALLPLLEATPDLPGSAPELPDWQPWLGPDLQWHTERLVGERLHLRAQAWTRFELGRELDDSESRSALALPPGDNPRTLAWAQEMRARLGAADARTLSAALLAYIGQAPYVYTLNPGSYGGDAIDAFWLDRREGFCEHFATAYVVVMRAMGVPARVVAGYQGAEPPDADGYQAVRQSHAHAWAEYWAEGAGWLRADPTAAVAPERVRSSRPLLASPGLMTVALNTMSPALAERLRRAWDLVDSRWAQWVMGYSSSRQFELLRGLGIPHPDWSDLARLLGGLLAAVAGAGGVWAVWDHRRQDPWTALHLRLCARLQAAGVPALPHHPPATLAAAVRARHGGAGEPLAQTLDALDRHRYAPGGGRMPAPGWWASMAREARRLHSSRPLGTPALPDQSGKSAPG